MSLFKALKFKIDRFLIARKIRKEQYSWFVVSNNLNQGNAVFRPSNKRKITYRQWKDNKKDEKEISKLVEAINDSLDVDETCDEYKAFVAKHYKEQGYTVWEYSKDMIHRDELDLVLKKSKNIILVKCKNSNEDIDIKQIVSFEAQADKFLKKNQVFEHYSIKLRYTMSSLLLEEEAYDYIKSHSDRLDYDIIKPTTPKP